MFLFILFCICVLVVLGSIGVAVLGHNHKDDDFVFGGVSVAAIFAVIAVVLLLFTTITSVGTKNLGVKTVGGRPVGYLTNGYHFKAPWVSVKELTNAVQTDTYASDGSGGQKQGGAVGTCVNVRIARQATACVNVSIRWQAKASGIDYLFRNFKNNDAITDNLVLRDLQQAMNEEFASYDPLGIDNNGNSTNKPLSSSINQNNFSTLVTNDMRADIGTWIDVQSVIIPLLNFDGDTQARINQVQQQVGATRVAQQQKVTNEAQAAANRALASSVSNDPGVLESKCLDILKDAVDKGQQLPAGFSCFGSSSGVAIGVK